jgi:hypothetical protein
MQIFMCIVTAYLIMLTIITRTLEWRVAHVAFAMLAGLGATGGIVRLLLHPSKLSALIAEICIILVMINAFRARSAPSST